MRKLIIITLAMSFAFISCNKENNKPDPKWTIYNADNGLNGSVGNVVCDLDGKVFISTTGGINTIDNGYIELYTFDDHIPGNLHLDNQGNVWAGYPLIKFENNSWINPIEDLTYVTKFANGANNSLWFATGGVTFVNYSGQNYTEYTIPDSITDHEEKIICLTEDKSENLWIGTWDGLYRFDGVNWQEYDPFPESTVKRVQCMLVSGDGDLYVSVYYAGVRKYDGNTWTIVEDLPSKWIKSMYESTNKDIWFGTQYDGIARYTGTEMIIYQDDFMTEGPINDIDQATDGSMWFAENNSKSYEPGILLLTDWE